MNILDASTLINLMNGDGLELVVHLEGFSFAIGPIVLSECGDEKQLARLLTEGRIAAIDGDSLPAASFLDLLGRFGLGHGETECLAIATSIPGAVICCDDGAARKAIATVLGPQGLSGSLGLLREAVRQQRATAGRAFAIYEQMRARGGFLPDIDQTFFTSTSNS